MKASRSDAGQLVGHAGDSGHSATFRKGFSPSTNREKLLETFASVRLRAPGGGLVSSLASMEPQSNGYRVPRELLLLADLIEKSSCLAFQRYKNIYRETFRRKSQNMNNQDLDIPRIFIANF